MVFFLGGGSVHIIGVCACTIFLSTHPSYPSIHPLPTQRHRNTGQASIQQQRLGDHPTDNTTEQASSPQQHANGVRALVTMMLVTATWSPRPMCSYSVWYAFCEFFLGGARFD